MGIYIYICFIFIFLFFFTIHFFCTVVIALDPISHFLNIIICLFLDDFFCI